MLVASLLYCVGVFYNYLTFMLIVECGMCRHQRSLVAHTAAVSMMVSLLLLLLPANYLTT